MKILKTTLIEFNEVAERNRLTKHFKGQIRDRLLAIHDAFVACKWDECHELMRALSRDELEFLSSELFDVMKARSERAKSQRQYPKFMVDDYID